MSGAGASAAFAPQRETVEIFRRVDYSSVRLSPIPPMMEEQAWSFSRNDEQLEVRRSQTTDGFLLSVGGDDARTYFFEDEQQVVQFQADFEKFLLGTGWLLLGFSPERRAGRERRHFSRLLTDRRRWWTDGLRTPPEREREARLRRLQSRRRPTT